MNSNEWSSASIHTLVRQTYFFFVPLPNPTMCIGRTVCSIPILNYFKKQYLITAAVMVSHNHNLLAM